MKKYILLCTLCLCINELCHSQFYLKGYTGYALSTGNDKLISAEMIETSEIIDSEEYKRIYSYKEYQSSYRLKFGQGVNLGLSVGYELNKNIAFEITGNTQLFTKFSYSNPYKWNYILKDNDYMSSAWGSYGNLFGDMEYSNTLFQISPQVVFKSNPCNQWIFYMKGGTNYIWVIHKSTTLHSATQFIYSDFNTPSKLYAVKYSGKTNIGVQFSFGTEYKLSENISAFAELTTVTTNYTFTKGRTLRYEIDGVDSLSELDSPTYDEDYKTSFSHIGLNFGIKYSF
jgi:hypothetical protein